MADDLDLDDQRYAWVLSIFFFGYLLCEVPSNMILARSRPSIFLPGIMIVWGALSAAMSSAKSYGAMLAFRFVVGSIESGFFPGVLYLLSCWYTSAELGKSPSHLFDFVSTYVFFFFSFFFFSSPSWDARNDLVQPLVFRLCLQ